MNKKIISLLLAAILAFSLCACSSSPSGATVSGGKSGGAAEIEAVTDNKKPQSAPVPAVADPVRPVSVIIGSSSLSDRDMTDYTLYYSQEWFTLALDGSCRAEYPALAAALDAWSADTAAAADETYAENDAYARETLTGSDFFSGMEFNASTRAYVMRADSRYVSVCSNYQDYMGGAHGYYANSGLTWDSRTGRFLTAKDIFTDLNALCEALKTVLAEKYPMVVEINAASIDYYFNAVLNGEKELDFCLGCEGAVFWFNPYEIASYAEGMQTITLSYADWLGLFPDGCVDSTGNYIVPLSAVGDSVVDIDGDGLKDYLYSVSEYVDGGYWYRYGLSVNGEKIYPEGAEGYSSASYFVRYNGSSYVYIFVTSDNDYVNLYVVNTADGTCSAGVNFYIPVIDMNLDPASYYTYYRRSFTDPDNMLLGSRLYTLGTYTGIRSYAPDLNGVPSCAPGTPYQIDGYYDLVSTASFGGISISRDTDWLADLSALTLTGKTSSGDAVRVEIPAGSTMRVVGTDNEGFVAVQLADGSRVAVSMQHDGWPWMLDNRKEDALFEMLPYAG